MHDFSEITPAIRQVIGTRHNRASRSIWAHRPLSSHVRTLTKDCTFLLCKEQQHILKQEIINSYGEIEAPPFFKDSCRIEIGLYDPLFFQQRSFKPAALTVYISPSSQAVEFLLNLQSR
jgi:hypothetical protein